MSPPEEAPDGEMLFNFQNQTFIKPTSARTGTFVYGDSRGKRPDFDEKHTSSQGFEEPKSKNRDLAPGESKMANVEADMSTAQYDLGESNILRAEGRTLAENQLTRVPRMKTSLDKTPRKGETRDADRD